MHRFPVFSRYDPKVAGEGNLDPLGLGQLADQLAVELVPAIRERMSRVRFLSAITVGAVVLEELGRETTAHGVEPFLVWEWLVIESLVRSEADGHDLRNVPGSQMTRRALRDQGYLDAASYLKTPRIFGFHGVYKRLALRLGLIDADLAPGPASSVLLEAWAKGQRMGSFDETQPLRNEWRRMVGKGLGRPSPSTQGLLTAGKAAEIGGAFAPSPIPAVERRVLRQFLLEPGMQELGALPVLWEIVAEPKALDLPEREIHGEVSRRAPQWRPLVNAIQCYETFARTLQDAFDFLRVEAGLAAERGLALDELGLNHEFAEITHSLRNDYERADEALSGLEGPLASAPILFRERFESLGAAPVADLPTRLLEHHDRIQKAKPPGGKRSWFDRIETGRVFLRHPYRLGAGWEPQPGAYVHPYRTRSIHSFRRDLQ